MRPTIKLNLDYEKANIQGYFQIPATLLITLQVNDRMFSVRRAILQDFSASECASVYEQAWSEIYTVARREGYLP